jgi:hypothetical protein
MSNPESPIPEPTPQRFTYVRDLMGVGGSMNKGISVMADSKTNNFAIRKRIDPSLRKDYTTQDVASMRQLAPHPNIVQLLDFVPAAPDSDGYAMDYMDEMYLEYCAVTLGKDNAIKLH